MPIFVEMYLSVMEVVRHFLWSTVCCAEHQSADLHVRK